MDNLDNLFDMIKGGVTKDFEIGHVSHRRDGDYKKVAQGKWVPVSAAGGAKEKPVVQRMGELKNEPWSNERYFEEYEKLNKRQADPAKMSKEQLTQRVSEMLKTDPTMKKIVGEGKNNKAPEPKKNPYKFDQDKFMEVLQESSSKYNDPSKVKVYKTPKGNWDTYYDGHRIGIIGGDKLDSEAAAELGWYEGVWSGPTPDLGDEPEAPKAEGKRELKHRADGTPIYESPEDVIYDMVENYNELDRGDLQGVIEAAAMEHGWDENEILEEVDRQAAEKYDLNVDAAPGIAKKAVELAQRDYTDVPGRVLTADTKIRLSKIKRETCDARRTYRIGEISEKTGLQKTANGWREVKKGGAGSAAPKAEGGNDAERKALIKMRDELMAEHDMGKKRQSNAWYQKKKAFEQRLDAYKKDSAPAGGKAEVNPITGIPMRPETVAYAQQKKAEAEQKRNTEKTPGGFTMAQNDKIKNAATDVIFKRRGERLTSEDLQRDYKMSETEANETVRRVNEYFENLQKDRKEFSHK